MSRPITEVLSIQRVQEAYAKTGLRPSRRVWLGSGSNAGCACAIGAVLKADGLWDAFEADRDTQAWKRAAKLLDADEEEVDAFIMGFDAGPCITDRREGVHHGDTVARAVGAR